MPHKQEITWYKMDEKEPPDLVRVIFKVLSKFHTRKLMIRTGYYNKQLNKYYIPEFSLQFLTKDNFVDLDNEFIKILEWADIEA